MTRIYLSHCTLTFQFPSVRELGSDEVEEKTWAKWYYPFIAEAVAKTESLKTLADTTCILTAVLYIYYMPLATNTQICFVELYFVQSLELVG